MTNKPENSLDDKQSLTQEVGDLVSLSLDYAANRLALVSAEAKLSLVSIVMLLALAILGVLLIAVVWLLCCLAAVYALISASILSKMGAYAVVIVANLLLIVLIAWFANSLVRSINLSSLRHSIETEKGQSDQENI